MSATSGDDGLLVAHCRPGFEAEAALDVGALAAAAQCSVECEAVSRAALVVARPSSFVARRWADAMRRAPPVFVRSRFMHAVPIAFDGRDRIGPVVAHARQLGPLSVVWVEHPDSDSGRELSGMGRRIAPLMQNALRDAGALVDDPRAPRLHVLFTERDRALVGTSDPALDSPWPMGIPRLRMPPGAPSRSTLKLAEAFVTFLGDHEPELLRPGMRAVDLGAAPGGWSWQLAYRGLRVTAVDNGALRGAAADDPLIEHLREDGLSWHPRRPVDWMTCDIVEKPARIAALVARWIAMGDARRTIFNLKLPMKRRYEEVARCRTLIDDTLAKAGVRYTLAVKQLYHDREEVTGYLARVD